MLVPRLPVNQFKLCQQNEHNKYKNFFWNLQTLYARHCVGSSLKGPHPFPLGRGTPWSVQQPK